MTTSPASATEGSTHMVAAYLLLAVPPLFWSGNFVIARSMAEVLPPVGFAFWRWVAALAILLPFVWSGLIKHRATLLQAWRTVLLLGAFGVAGFNVLTYLALETTETVNAAVMNSAIPILIPICAWVMAGERITRWQVAGTALSLVGVAFIVARGDLGILASLSFAPGDLWMLIAVVNWSVYSVLLRRCPAGVPSLVLLAAMIITGLAVLFPFLVLELALGHTVPITTDTAAAIAYVAVFASLVAFIAWNRSIAVLGPVRTGLSVHLIPLLAALLAWLFLAEPVRAFHLYGAILILFGLVLANRRAAAAG